MSCLFELSDKLQQIYNVANVEQEYVCVTATSLPVSTFFLENRDYFKKENIISNSSLNSPQLNWRIYLRGRYINWSIPSEIFNWCGLRLRHVFILKASGVVCDLLEPLGKWATSGCNPCLRNWTAFVNSLYPVFLSISPLDSLVHKIAGFLYSLR